MAHTLFLIVLKEVCYKDEPATWQNGEILARSKLAKRYYPAPSSPIQQETCKRSTLQSASKDVRHQWPEHVDPHMTSICAKLIGWRLRKRDAYAEDWRRIDGS
jgi:hypothetical protein